MPKDQSTSSEAGSTPLPSYENPPLEEVVCGIQFESLKQFTSARAGLFWNAIRDRYPQNEDQPPLPHQKELPEPQPTPENQFFQMPFTPRSWFLSADKTQLVQLQRDRFVRNWRRVNGNEEYPRFPTLIGDFKRDWLAFDEYVKTEQLGEIKIDQCELTYINHIDKGEGWNSFAEIGKVFNFIQPTSRSGLLIEPETLSWAGAYKLPDGRGRLSVEMNPAFRGRDLKMVLSLIIRARGAPLGESTEEAFSWLELAHEWVVKSFDDLTDPEMHKLWKKIT